MITETDETLEQLFRGIVEDFQSQLDGQFHRGGPSGLSFEPVREPDEDPVRGFRIVTGGSEWQARPVTVRACAEGGVLQLTGCLEVEGEKQDPVKYSLWMNVETLEGLHRLAREYVQQNEIAQDCAGRIAGEQDLYRRVMEKVAAYYRQAEQTACRYDPGA